MITQKGIWILRFRMISSLVVGSLNLLSSSSSNRGPWANLYHRCEFWSKFMNYGWLSVDLQGYIDDRPVPRILHGRGRHNWRGCIMSSLTTCSGQGVVVQEKEKEKECVVEDIRNGSSQWWDSYSKQARFESQLQPRVEGDRNNAEVTQDEAQLVLRHVECRRARISQGYKAKEPSHTYLRQ